MSVITVQELELETKLDLVPTLLLLASAGTKLRKSFTKLFFRSNCVRVSHIILEHASDGRQNCSNIEICITRKCEGDETAVEACSDECCKFLLRTISLNLVDLAI